MSADADDVAHQVPTAPTAVGSPAPSSDGASAVGSSHVHAAAPPPASATGEAQTQETQTDPNAFYAAQTAAWQQQQQEQLNHIHMMHQQHHQQQLQQQQQQQQKQEDSEASSPKASAADASSAPPRRAARSRATRARAQGTSQSPAPPDAMLQPMPFQPLQQQQQQHVQMQIHNMPHMSQQQLAASAPWFAGYAPYSFVGPHMGPHMWQMQQQMRPSGEANVTIVSAPKVSRSGELAEFDSETRRLKASSLDVFKHFIKEVRNANGTVTVDPSGVLSRPCYDMWLRTRRKLPRVPEETFRKTLISHITKSDRGSVPFEPHVEAALLELVRQKRVWPCFLNATSSDAAARPINIGAKGLRAKGYHELRKDKAARGASDPDAAGSGFEAEGARLEDGDDEGEGQAPRPSKRRKRADPGAAGGASSGNGDHGPPPPPPLPAVFGDGGHGDAAAAAQTLANAASRKA